MLFWLKFIFPNISIIESGHSEIVISKIRQNFIDNHVSYIYENICLETLWELNEKNTWPFHFDRVGQLLSLLISSMLQSHIDQIWRNDKLTVNSCRTFPPM